MASERIEKWPEIAKYFPCAESTFMNKHSQAMLKAGYAFKSHTTQHGIKKNL